HATLRANTYAAAPVTDAAVTRTSPLVAPWSKTSVSNHTTASAPEQAEAGANARRYLRTEIGISRWMFAKRTAFSTLSMIRYEAATPMIPHWRPTGNDT